MKYRNILLIDDDTDDAYIFREAVNAVKESIIMQHEHNPLVALENLKFAEKLPDLILLDFNMPYLNGREFLCRLKCESNLCSIPVILISSPPEEFVIDLLENNQIRQYISKPNSFSELITIFKSILEA